MKSNNKAMKNNYLFNHLLVYSQIMKDKPKVHLICMIAEASPCYKEGIGSFSEVRKCVESESHWSENIRAKELKGGS